MLSVENVRKEFGAQAILDGASMAVASGEIVGLVGPSGCGKSTLLRCIQGLETIGGGKIVVGGRAGFMFQDFQLFPHMTALKNVSYAANLRTNRSFSATADGVRKILEHLGIWDLRDRRPRSLSGGQKQRVAMARTLALNPDLILCDEPTSGLDEDSTADVANLLRSVVSSRKAVLIASHDMDFLAAAADRVLLLKNGKIVPSAAPKKQQGHCDGKPRSQRHVAENRNGAARRLEFRNCNA
ncbi:MAG: ATP-binding cassette domain-containing protein [Puniceicoccales bacterium]|jgi:polar amino acid transport system ATP-binding protein|nr:ATP-binding cassette domain-containing protein [Puniceicoccales bacterium]